MIIKDILCIYDLVLNCFILSTGDNVVVCSQKNFAALILLSFALISFLFQSCFLAVKHCENPFGSNEMWFKTFRNVRKGYYQHLIQSLADISRFEIERISIQSLKLQHSQSFQSFYTVSFIPVILLWISRYLQYWLIWIETSH